MDLIKVFTEDFTLDNRKPDGTKLALRLAGEDAQNDNISHKSRKNCELNEAESENLNKKLPHTLEISLARKHVADKQYSPICECPPILIVDDQLFNRISLTAMLKVHNIASDTANNGIEAVKYVKSRFKSNKCCPLPQAIIMDIDMPDLDGISASELIFRYLNKQNQELIKIYIHTSYLDTNYRQKCRAVGIKEFLSKPVKKTEIDAICQELMLNSKRKQSQQKESVENLA